MAMRMARVCPSTIGPDEVIVVEVLPHPANSA